MRPANGAALLLIVTALLYLPTLGYSFVYEDFNDLPLLLDPSLAGNYGRSLTHWSHVFSAWLTPGSPVGYHAVNVAVHLLNVGLMLALARTVFLPWVAVFVAAVFALHPIQVEAVAYVSARADVLACSGVLLALCAASRGSLAGALVGLVLATLAKETAIVAWGLVPLWAAWTAAPRLKSYLLGGLAGGLVASIAVLTHIREAHLALPNQIQIGEQLVAIWRLTGAVLVPVGLTIDHDWAALAWLGPVALIAALGMTTWALTIGWWTRASVALAWLWTLVALSPRFVVPLTEGLHEHHFYFIVPVWALCAGAVLSSQLEPRMEFRYATD